MLQNPMALAEAESLTTSCHSGDHSSHWSLGSSRSINWTR